MDGTLGLYVHVPFCKHACPYCDFYKLELRDRPARARLEFPDAVAAELRLHLAADPSLRRRTLDTIYFGGGTPSTLVPEAVGDLIHTMVDEFTPGAVPAEVTLEANPENLTEGRAAKWYAAGVNRLSIGMQSFDARELTLLERLHGRETITRAFEAARAAGFRNIGLDLMFALPGQTPAGWRESLAAAAALAPEHLSFYGLTIHEETPFHREFAQGRLAQPPEDEQASMYLEGAALLEAAGYEHYEISNFARPGFRSRHNQRYWTRRDVLGLGPSAHTSLGDRRWFNRHDLDGWAAATARGERFVEEVETLASGVALEERLFCLLRRSDGIDAATDPELHALVGEWLARQPEAAPWFHSEAGRLRLTREGWLRSDAILLSLLGAGRAAAPAAACLVPWVASPDRVHAQRPTPKTDESLIGLKVTGVALRQPQGAPPLAAPTEPVADFESWYLADGIVALVTTDSGSREVVRLAPERPQKYALTGGKSEAAYVNGAANAGLTPEMWGCFPYYLLWRVYAAPIPEEEITEAHTSAGTQLVFDHEPREGGVRLMRYFEFYRGQWIAGHGEVNIPEGYTPGSPSVLDRKHLEWALAEYGPEFPSFPRLVTLHTFAPNAAPQTGGSRITAFERIPNPPSADALFDQLSKGMPRLR
ncbi:MAG: radical SAM family heme chaperone HemW [Candidatus Sumerlaeia bacterium]|nr:radical SAM family heme chaperone HemW [Candidatus Sumerlaeia bacterium]